MQHRQGARSKLLRAGCAALLVLSTACADQTATGVSRSPRVSGTLRWDGKVSDLRHGYALRIPFSEGERPSDPALVVVLGNEPITPG